MPAKLHYHTLVFAIKHLAENHLHLFGLGKEMAQHPDVFAVPSVGPSKCQVFSSVSFECGIGDPR